MFYYMTYTITNRFFQYAKSRLGLNSVIGGTALPCRRSICIAGAAGRP